MVPEFKHPGEYFKKKIVFETPRLLLRRIDLCDVRDMYAYSSCENVTEYLLWSPHQSEYITRCVVEKLKRDYREGMYHELAVIFKETGKMIGTCGITSVDTANYSAEIGYVLSSEYWGNGLAFEAASVLQNFAFCELGANRVEAKYIVGNENSRRVMEKLGMRFEGIQRSKLFVKGAFRDIGIYSVLADEYFAVPRENLYKKFNNTGLFDVLFSRFK